MLALLPDDLQPAWHTAVRFMNWFCLRGPGYQFWSGIGLVIFLPATYYWHHTCHVRWCLRLGHPEPEHGHPACSRHATHAAQLGQPPPSVE